MKRVISTDKAPKAVGAYSQAIDCGDTLYVSGQLAIDPATNALIEGDTASQTRQILQNVEAILKAAGYSLDDVVQCLCILDDLSEFKAMNEIYATFFKQNQPARVAYEASKLPLDAKLEIAVTARK